MQTVMMSNLPDWIVNLKKGDTVVVCFPYTGNTIFAEVVENCPDNFNYANTFGTLTVKYTWNNVERTEDLIYDDYNQSKEFQNNWHAYCVI